MSEVANPYQSPEVSAIPEKPIGPQVMLTETMLGHLKAASPWLRFIGIMGFIGAALAALWGVFSIALAPLIGRTWGEMPQGYRTLSSSIIGPAFGGGMFILSIGGGLAIFFPALFAYRFGEKIRSYLRTGVERDLEMAFKNNRSLWKFFGIICIINYAVVPLIIIGGIVAALVSSI